MENKITPIMVEVAELSMVLTAANTIINAGKRSRLNGLATSLCRAIVRRTASHGKLSDVQNIRLARLVEDFATHAGWLDTGKHILTLVSFLLALFDGRSGYERINEILSGIHAHIEYKNQAPAACNWAGAVALEKWDAAVADACENITDS